MKLATLNGWFGGLMRTPGQFPRLNGVQLWACLLPVYLLVHLGLRLFEGQTLRWDESEQMLFSQRLALGYNDQPPVYTWLLWAMFQLTGVSLSGLYLLKMLLLACCYLGIFAVARRQMPASFAIPASASLLLTPYFAWSVLIDGAHTLFVAVFVPVTFWMVLRLLERPSSMGFASLGLVLGMGVLAKYSFAMLAIAIPLAMFTVPNYRTRLKDPRLLLTILIAFLLVAPHAWWVMENWQTIRERPMIRSGVWEDAPFAIRVGLGFVSLGRTTLLAVGSLLALLVAMFPSQCRRIVVERTQSESVRLLGRWLAIVCGLLALLVFLGVTRFRTHWLIPIVVMFPVYVFARFAEEPPSVRIRNRFMTLVCLAVMVACGVRLVGIAAENREGGKLWGQGQMHSALAGHLSMQGLDRATFVGDHPIVCGNIRLAFPNAKVICCYYPAFTPVESIAPSSIVVAWEASDLAEPMPRLQEFLIARGMEPEPGEAFYFETPSASPRKGLRRIGVRGRPSNLTSLGNE